MFSDPFVHVISTAHVPHVPSPILNEYESLL